MNLKKGNQSEKNRKEIDGLFELWDEMHILPWEKSRKNAAKGNSIISWWFKFHSKI
jgi:hypothetical protein